MHSVGSCITTYHCFLSGNYLSAVTVYETFFKGWRFWQPHLIHLFTWHPAALWWWRADFQWMSFSYQHHFSFKSRCTLDSWGEPTILFRNMSGILVLNFSLFVLSPQFKTIRLLKELMYFWKFLFYLVGNGDMETLAALMERGCLHVISHSYAHSRKAPNVYCSSNP